MVVIEPLVRSIRHHAALWEVAYGEAAASPRAGPLLPTPRLPSQRGDTKSVPRGLAASCCSTTLTAAARHSPPRHAEAANPAVPMSPEWLHRAPPTPEDAASPPVDKRAKAKGLSTRDASEEEEREEGWSAWRQTLFQDLFR